MKLEKEEGVSMQLMTLRPDKSKERTANWKTDKIYNLPSNMDQEHIIEFEWLKGKLEDPAYPFKTYLLVPVAERDKYYVKLVMAQAVITGAGEQGVGSEVGNWRIWFLFPDALLHGDIEGLYRMNMCLPPAKG